MKSFRLRQQADSEWAAGLGSWGGHVGTSVDASLSVGSERVTNIVERRITIRAVDPQADREGWVGSATGEVQPDFHTSALERAIAAVLADFPARHPTVSDANALIERPDENQGRGSSGQRQAGSGSPRSSRTFVSSAVLSAGF